MSDPAIKLFGKTIQLPDTLPPPTHSQLTHADIPSSPTSTKHNSDEADKDPIMDDDTPEEDGTQDIIVEKPTNSSAVSAIKDDTKLIDSKAALDDDQNTEDAQNEASNSEGKTLKKPDKIIACPRCNSMDTKFCYYNNYNVNQPRHFCKNCQRYWTAGGTMRNVPVGAGRRKNKYSASHYRHIGVSEALQNVGVEVQNVIDHPALKTNGTVLTFGSDVPLCESMTSVLNLSGKTISNSSTNGLKKKGELKPSVSYGAKDNGDDHTNKSSVTSSSSKDEIITPSVQNQVIQNCHSFPPQLPCFPGAAWPYPWGQWNTPITQVPPPPPGFCGFPMPYYPPAHYWGCNIPVPGAWNVQWVTPTTLSANHTAPSSGPNSPTLGKHSRDENVPNPTRNADEGLLKENNPGEKSLWVPKTLRIDDPGEAAKSSIWATLGIKNEIADSDNGRRGMFKAFQSKGDEKDHISNSSAVLHANPAAVSRSQRFHEST